MLKSRIKLWLSYFSLALLSLVLLSALVLASPPLAHVRHYLLRGAASIDDFERHPTRAIAPAPQPQAWPLAPQYNRGEIAPDLLLQLEAQQTTAFLVFQNGALLYERYWDGHNAQTLTQGFSVAKSVVSMLVGVAVGEGKIQSLDQAVADFLPAFKAGDKAKITLRQVLSMSSGLNWQEREQGAMSNQAKAYFGDDVQGVINRLEATQPSGKSFVYSSGDAQVLAMVLEQLYQQPLADLLAQKLWHKVGAQSPAAWMLDREGGHEKAYCCLATTAQDLARLGHLMLWSGQWRYGNQVQQVVPAAYMEEALSPAYFLADPRQNNAPMQWYGQQFWLQPYKGRVYPSMRGLKGQLVWAVPERNALILRLGRQENKARDETGYFGVDSQAYLQAGLNLLNPVPPEPAKPWVAKES
jgi:CubicO group peptidase (beta-lactamase class C family)